MVLDDEESFSKIEYLSLMIDYYLLDFDGK